jgi:hypothetical protein
MQASTLGLSNNVLLGNPRCLTEFDDVADLDHLEETGGCFQDVTGRFREA